MLPDYKKSSCISKHSCSLNKEATELRVRPESLCSRSCREMTVRWNSALPCSKPDPSSPCLRRSATGRTVMLKRLQQQQPVSPSQDEVVFVPTIIQHLEQHRQKETSSAVRTSPLLVLLIQLAEKRLAASQPDAPNHSTALARFPRKFSVRLARPRH